MSLSGLSGLSGLSSVAGGVVVPAAPSISIVKASDTSGNFTIQWTDSVAGTGGIVKLYASVTLLHTFTASTPETYTSTTTPLTQGDDYNFTVATTYASGPPSATSPLPGVAYLYQTTLLLTGTGNPDFGNWSIQTLDNGFLNQIGNNLYLDNGNPVNVYEITYVGTTAAGVVSLDDFTGDNGTNTYTVSLNSAQFTNFTGLENISGNI